MGPSGVEGIFKSCAEETMLLLRENSRDLLTILSAVVADPSYRWKADPSEARRRQIDNDQEVSGFEGNDKQRKNQRRSLSATVTGSGETKTANDKKNQEGLKTIAKIKQKLEGYEDSTSGDQQGVEGQVELLINSARDPNLLKDMFVGWAPWI